MSTDQIKRGAPSGLVARLVYSEGTSSERIFRLNPDEPEVLVGRDRACLIRTTRRNVSRRHCAIRWTGSEYEVRDLDSANGTFVNGREVSSQALTDGDEVRCGLDFRIWFLLGSSEDRVTRAHVFLNFDKPLLERVEERITVGRSFVFIPADLFAKAKMPWVQTLFGPEASRARILPLLGPDPIELPGVRVRPMVPPALRVVSVTCDRGIYQVGEEPVTVFVFDPLNPRRRFELVVSHGEEEFTRRDVSLDDNGCGLVRLLKLPVGAYRVTVDGVDAPTARCRFMVSEYRLAPMTVTIDELSWSESFVTVGLWVESYGEPISGPLRVDFQDDEVVLERQQVTARSGRARVQVMVDGEGPYALVVRCVDDTAKTASVQLVGHHRVEREETLFSGLGREVTGALTPMEGARNLRGVYLRDGAERLTPMTLEERGPGRVRLTASVAIEVLCVAVIDPTCPRIKPDRLLTSEVSHPGLSDPLYQEAELLYQEGDHARAQELFESSRGAQMNPHPYYAYYIACCRARSGDHEGAVQALRSAIDDGWSDADQLREDDDLATLRGALGFESLLRQGQTLHALEAVASGHELELEVPGPIALVSIGALIDGRPWEGFACVLRPSALEVGVRAPATASPQEPLSISVDAPSGASVHVMVRDSRLVSLDQTNERLASQLKSFVHTFSEANPSGWVESTLHDAISPRTATGQYRRAAAAGEVDAPAQAPSDPPPPGNMYSLRSISPTEQGVGMGRSARQPWQLLADQPQMLFAGVLTASEGQARVEVEPQDVGSLEIDAFVALRGDWSRAQAEVRVVQEPLARFQVPEFVHPLDRVVGRLHVRAASGRWRVELERDGEEVTVLADGVALEPGAVLTTQEQALTFLAAPGEYRATVVELEGRRWDSATARVHEPGVFVGEALTTRILGPGDELSMEEPGVLGARAVTSLQGALERVADAVLERSVSNCEEVAAQAVAAAVLWRWTSGAARERAVALLQASLERLERMWIRSLGFRIHLGARREPSAYYGHKASQYLVLLGDVVLGDAGELSSPLARLREVAQAMARDTLTSAAGPAAQLTCEESYQALARGSRAPGLIERVRQLAPNGALPPAAPGPTTGRVNRRAEAGYAAAACLRARAETPLALALMNRLLGQVDERGGLYSTMDSVAALMALHEAQRVGLVTGEAALAVDGEPTPLKGALGLERARTIRCVQGLTPLEVRRRVRRDWLQPSPGLSVRVALEKAGRAARRFVVGDVLNLVVVLPEESEPGDLLHVCLPDALSRVVGGVQDKMWTVHFRGQRSVQVPLVATSATLDERGHLTSQRFLVCVRSAYDDTRRASSGWIEISVAA